MLVKHVCNDELNTMSREILVNFLKEAFRAIDNCKTLLQAFKEFEDGEIDDFDLEDVLENPYFVNTSYLHLFHNSCYSKYANLTMYLGDILEIISLLQKTIHTISDAGVSIKPEWLAEMKNCCESIIGGLSYIIWYEFSLDIYLKELEDDNLGAEASLDEIIDAYSDMYNWDSVKLAHSVRDNRTQYKFNLEFFDEYPEHEDLFYELMGPFAAGIDNDKLTIDLVLQLEKAEITPMELNELCQ